MAPANPTPSHPSVFILKSQDSSGTTACLAKDFYPEEVKISMNPGSPVLYERAEPVLTAGRKYGAIKIVNTSLNEDVHCSVQHNHQKIDRTLAPEKQPDFTTASVPEACRSSDSSLQDEEMEKTNALSITILGLRLLLTKSIALNMIMVTGCIMV